MVRHYFDTTKDVLKHPEELLLANTYYMWDTTTPLQQYMYRQFRTTPGISSLKRWSSMGPLYKDYGSFLIRHYPKVFLQFYILPNAAKYYAPPVEYLDSYNMGRDTVAGIAKAWFRYPSNKVHTAFKSNNVNVLNFYPILAGSLNVVLLLSLLFYWILKGFKEDPISRRAVVLTTACWLTNFCFSVFASPIALRFQIFPLTIFLCFTCLLVEYIYKSAFGASSVRNMLTQQNISYEKYVHRIDHL
jgi:hypothetical protein